MAGGAQGHQVLRGMVSRPPVVYLQEPPAATSPACGMVAGKDSLAVTRKLSKGMAVALVTGKTKAGSGRERSTGAEQAGLGLEERRGGRHEGSILDNPHYRK